MSQKDMQLIRFQGNTAEFICEGEPEWPTIDCLTEERKTVISSFCEY